jgi:replicative DNA helicase
MDQPRAFPQALEAERALLGGLLQRPDLLADISALVRPVDFYRHDHQQLFKLLLEMNARGDAIDMVTVPERVAREESQERYGGVAYVVELPDHVPSTANLGHYAETVRQKAVLRALIATADQLSDAAYQQPDDVTGLLDRAAQEIVGLGQEGTHGDWVPISLVVDDELIRIEQLGERSDGVTGVATGFIDLDHKLAGLQPGDLVILAGRPSMGKTALALNIAQNASVMTGVGVGIYSLEMSRQQLVDRMLCAHAMVNASKVRTGRLDVKDWERFLEASETLRKARIHINDAPGLTVAEIRAHARRLVTQDPNLGLLVVDYIQLMASEDPRQSRVQAVSDMSRGLKALAKDLHVPVLALSQLSRGVEQRQDKRPIMSDLRESGAIEQDADVILFIYRDEYYNPDTAEPSVAEVIIGKQRHGPTGMIRLVFQGRYTRFDNYAEEGGYL